MVITLHFECTFKCRLKSAISFNFDQSKILSPAYKSELCGKELNPQHGKYKYLYSTCSSFYHGATDKLVFVTHVCIKFSIERKM